MDAPIPPRVPGIELGTLLGAGGTSEVWEGVVEGEGRRVAVKVVRAEAEALEAAAREASVTARVAAEHVLAVEACLALDDGRAALVLPLMRGGGLGRLVAARGHLAPGEVVTVLAPLAAALGRLHAAGVVHGDVSPGNVLLDLDGRPVLADLGLGRVVGEAPTAVWGTEGYVAPEVLMGGDATPASDVYALGALGWLCLAGSPPGAPGLRPPLADLSRAGPGAADLVGILEGAVSPRPAERPGADELADRLFGVADPCPLRLVDGEDDVSAVTYRLRAAAAGPRHVPPARRRRPSRRGTALAGAGLLATVLLVGGVLGLLRHAAPDGAPSAAISSAPPGATPATSAVRTTRAPADDVRTDRAAPRSRPGVLLTALAEARARAWRTADVRRLTDAEAASGALHRRDVTDVASLADAGLRYAGLEYVVADVTTVEADRTRAVLRARLGTSGYTVTGGTAPVRRPAVPPAGTRVELTWTTDGWRVLDVR